MPTAVLRQPVTGPSVWVGPQVLAQGDYAVHLDARDLAEIDAAIVRLGDAVAEWQTLRRKDFPFDRLAKRLRAVGEEVDFGRGFALLRGIPVEKYTPDQRKALYWGIGCHVGLELVRMNRAGELITEIADVGLEFDTNTRGYRTRAELTPHNDPTDIVGLFCISAAKSGGESRITSSMAVYNEILEKHPEYLDVLFEGFYRDLRGEGRSGSLMEATPGKAPVYSLHQGFLSCRFNGRTILQAPLKTGQPMTALEEEAVRYIMQTAAEPRFQLEMRLQAGDIQLLNNHVTFHARNEFVDAPDEGRKRFLYRMWMNTLRRPLAADYAHTRLGYDHEDGVVKTV